MMSFRNSSFSSTKFETSAFESHNLSHDQQHDSSHLLSIIIQFSFNLTSSWSFSLSRSNISKKQHFRVQNYAIFAYFEKRDDEHTLNVANKKNIKTLNLISESIKCRRRTFDIIKLIDNKIVKFVRFRKFNFFSMSARIQQYKAEMTTEIVAQNEKYEKMFIWLRSQSLSALSFILIDISIVDSSIFFFDDFRKTTMIDFDCER